MPEIDRAELLLARIRGSHKDERRIKLLLGRDPEIHSGMLPRGNFALRPTQAEYEQLKAAGFHITLDRRSSLNSGVKHRRP